METATLRLFESLCLERVLRPAPGCDLNLETEAFLLEAAGIHLQEVETYVALLRFTGHSCPVPPEARPALADAVRALFPVGESCWCTWGTQRRFGDELLCLLNLPSAAEVPGRLRAIAALAETYIQGACRAQVSLSPLRRPEDRLSDCYRAAFDLARCGAMLESEVPVICREDYASPAHLSAGTEEEHRLETQYFTAVVNMDVDLAKSCIQRIADNTLSEPVSGCKELPIILSRCMNVLRSHLRGRHEIDAAFIGRIQTVLEQIDAAGTVRDLMACVFAFMESLKAEVQRTGLSKDPRIAEIQTFIREHYWERSLNVELLGDVFSLSPTYLSKIFKQATGVRLVDYIHKTRLDKVKAQLLETKRKLEEIAQCAGYENGWAMTRTFKRYYGITPSEYREIYLAKVK